MATFYPGEDHSTSGADELCSGYVCRDCYGKLSHWAVLSAGKTLGWIIYCPRCETLPDAKTLAEACSDGEMQFEGSGYIRPKTAEIRRQQALERSVEIRSVIRRSGLSLAGIEPIKINSTDALCAALGL